MLQEIANKIKTTANSRDFQSVVGQVGIAVVGIIVAQTVNRVVTGALNNQLNTLLDKIHGVIETTETPVTE